MQPFERLEAWKVCHGLVLAVYGITRRYPQEELYGLTSQTRRAAVSAAANIAEGSAKRGAREFRRYLDNARGSLAEVAYLILVAEDLELIPAAEAKALRDLRERAGFLTWRLYESLRRAAGSRTTRTGQVTARRG